MFGKLSRNKPLAIGIAVAILAVAAIIAWSQMRPPSGNPTQQQYYFDVGSGQLFAGPWGDTRPVEAPSGAKLRSGAPGGVKAVVYACGACTDASRFIGYVTVPLPDQLDRPPAQRRQADSMVATAEIGKAGEPKWVPFASKEGEAALNTALSKCGSEPATECTPPPKK